MTAGQPFASATIPRRRVVAPLDEDVGGLALVHRQRGLGDLERLAVEPILGRDPRRADAARDQELHRRDGDERLDESPRHGVLRDLVVVVDDEPRIRRPGVEILAEDLRERLDVLGRRRERAHVRSEPLVAVFDDRGGALRDTECERGDVRRRRARREPRGASTVARDPLLGERRLSVPSGSDEHPHARLRLVQRSANSLGRSTILRLRIRTSEDVAVVALS